MHTIIPPYLCQHLSAFDGQEGLCASRPRQAGGKQKGAACEMEQGSDSCELVGSSVSCEIEQGSDSCELVGSSVSCEME